MYPSLSYFSVRFVTSVTYRPDKQLFEYLFFSKEQLGLLVIWEKILELASKQNKDR